MGEGNDFGEREKRRNSKAKYKKKKNQASKLKKRNEKTSRKPNKKKDSLHLYYHLYVYRR